jgi:hypothetical protein
MWGGGVPKGCPRYGYGGGLQKPGLVGGQNRVRGSGSHVGVAPVVGDPPHDIEGA